MSTKKTDPSCSCCSGTGIRDVWVIDGWSFTDCLCTYGYRLDRHWKWYLPTPTVAETTDVQ